MHFKELKTWIELLKEKKTKVWVNDGSKLNLWKNQKLGKPFYFKKKENKKNLFIFVSTK